MRHARPDRFAGSRGFTLIESIIVVVVLSIAAAAIVSLQGNIFYGQSSNKDIQVGVQLMQECAEQILAIRRAIGYDNVSADCSGMTIGSYSAPTFDIAPYTGTGNECPLNATCKLVSIRQGGLTPVILLLVK